MVVVTAIGGRDNHVLKVIESQKKKPLKNYLNGLEPAQRPLPVVIDMSTTFKGAAQDSRLPIALVIDRYHVGRRANLALGHCRNKLIGGSDVEEDWEDRKQEIYNRAEASGARQLRIEGTGTKELDQMAAAYKATLWFQWILTAEISREEADEELDRWKSFIDPPIRENFDNNIFGTVRRWKKEILNYYEHRYTNGFNEGINNLVKKLDRIGMNYDRETIQAKLRHNQPSIGFFDVRISYADEDTLYDIQHGLKICGREIIDPQPSVERRDQKEKLRIPSCLHRAVRLERQGRIAAVECHRFGKRSDRLV
jgi:transposase